MGYTTRELLDGELTLDVAKITQMVTIDALNIKIVRDGAAVYSANMDNTSQYYLGESRVYETKDGYVKYLDNDNNTYVTQGDVIKISKDIIHSGDRVQIMFGTRTVYVAEVRVT